MPTMYKQYKELTVQTGKVKTYTVTHPLTAEQVSNLLSGYNTQYRARAVVYFIDTNCIHMGEPPNTMKIKCFQLLQAQRKVSLAIGFTKYDCIHNYIYRYAAPQGDYPSKVRQVNELIKKKVFLIAEFELTEKS